MNTHYSISFEICANKFNYVLSWILRVCNVHTLYFENFKTRYKIH